jgi:hypothetical protein
MGKRARIRPEKLGPKLLQIRLSLGPLTQKQMLQRLGIGDDYERNTLSNWERVAEPPLPILLKYE